MKKILIVDDHPTQIDGYRAILSLMDINLSFTSALNAEQAFRIITNPEGCEFDLVMLDWSIPEFPAQKIFNGEDLGILVRKYIPEAKIMLVTSHFKSFLLYNIAKNLKPEGLMVKSDFGGVELLDAFEKIMDGELYYTESVLEGLRKVNAQTEDLDEINRQIIVLLSEGRKTKSLAEHLRLAQSTIEKRKAHIKDYLGLIKGSDEEVVMEARKEGYI